MQVQLREPQKKVASVTDLSDDALECRFSNRHALVRTNEGNVVTNTRKEVIEFTRYLRCMVCGLEQAKTFSVPDFRCIKTIPHYPDDYLMQHRLDRNEARMEYVRRHFK